MRTHDTPHVKAIGGPSEVAPYLRNGQVPASESSDSRQARKSSNHGNSPELLMGPSRSMGILSLRGWALPVDTTGRNMRVYTAARSACCNKMQGFGKKSARTRRGSTMTRGIARGSMRYAWENRAQNQPRHKIVKDGRRAGKGPLCKVGNKKV